MKTDYYKNNEALKISSKDIHLWYAYDEELKNDDLLSQYHDLLSEPESIQQQRFHFLKHRHQYLITRALVRTVLSFYSSTIYPKEWLFGKNEYGKPCIDNPSFDLPLCFNISHTDKIVILAVSLENEIGIDVENIYRDVNTLDLAKHTFSPIEFNELCALPADEQKDRFFDLWTLKEAYIKACGMGLSIPLDQFSYAFPKQDKITVSFDARRNDTPEHWNFWSMRINDIHKIALAIKNMDLGINYTISIKEIVPFSEIKARDFSIVRQSD